MEFLASFGKFPNQKLNWTESDLNFTKLETKLDFFRISRCPSPKNESVQILCVEWEQDYPWRQNVNSADYLKNTAKDIELMFEALGFSTVSLDEILKEIENYPRKVNDQSELGNIFQVIFRAFF